MHPSEEDLIEVLENREVWQFGLLLLPLSLSSQKSEHKKIFRWQSIFDSKYFCSSFQPCVKCEILSGGIVLPPILTFRDIIKNDLDFESKVS